MASFEMKCMAGRPFFAEYRKNRRPGDPYFPEGTGNEDEYFFLKERLLKLEKDYGMKRTYELESKVGGMCDYSVGIAMKNYASGEAQGEAKGQEKLVDAVQRLRSGEKADDIINSGIDKDTVELALTIK